MTTHINRTTMRPFGYCSSRHFLNSLILISVQLWVVTTTTTLALSKRSFLAGFFQRIEKLCCPYWMDDHEILGSRFNHSSSAKGDTVSTRTLAFLIMLLTLAASEPALILHRLLLIGHTLLNF
jgi:hypothetical protein